MKETITLSRYGQTRYRLIELADDDTWEWEVPYTSDLPEVVLYQPTHYDEDDAATDAAHSELTVHRAECRISDGEGGGTVWSRTVSTPGVRHLYAHLVQEIRAVLVEEVLVEAVGGDLNPPTRYELREDISQVGVAIRPRLAEDGDTPAWIGNLRVERGGKLCLIDLGSGNPLAEFTHPEVSISQRADGRITLDLGKSGLLPEGSKVDVSSDEIRYTFGSSEWVPLR